MLYDVIIPVAVFIVLGILMGGALYIASKVFAVETDERTAKIIDALPGANCGGCGYAGCAALAEAIVKGEAEVSACPVGGAASAASISDIMGVEFAEKVKLRACIMCFGKTQYVQKKYIYNGISDCVAASKLGGGDKLCPSGCIGLGNCVNKCKFDAISIVDGIAVVDDKKCTGCGECLKACPKSLIKLISSDSKCFVGCMSCDNRKVTSKYCDVGCIGCRICEKNCSYGAVKVNGFIASIDNEKCIGCGVCAEKCPRGIISFIKSNQER